MERQARVLVIGVGNDGRGDDAAGLVVVRRLAGRVGPSVSLVEAGPDLTSLLDAWQGASAVVVVDAMTSGAAPGTLRRFDAAWVPLPARAFRATSSHAFGVAEIIELARALGRLPPRVVVYGIEVERMDAGAALTPAVEAGVRDAVCRVLDEVRAAVA
jgi:hydrogenase maturation protease